MPDSRDAQLLEVVRRQADENFFINRVFAESSLVLFKAKAPQPGLKLHEWRPSVLSARMIAPAEKLVHRQSFRLCCQSW